MHLLFVRDLKSPQNPVDYCQQYEEVEQEGMESPPAGIFAKRSNPGKVC